MSDLSETNTEPPGLRWEETRLGRRWQQGLSGQVCVAEISDTLGEDPWTWKVQWMSSDRGTDNHRCWYSSRTGAAPTEAAAKAAAEAAWAEWLDMAGLAPRRVA